MARLTPFSFVHTDDRDRVNKALRAILTRRVPCDMDHRLVLNGHGLTVNLQAEAVFDDQMKNPYSIVGTAQDITDRKESEQEIHRLAYFDSLTGLPNRVLFKDRLTQALLHAQRHRTTLATLFLDLDRFKVINDNFGYTTGYFCCS